MNLVLGASLLCLVASCGHQAARETPGGARYTNSIGMEFVLIKPGSFMMGSAPEPFRPSDRNETPQHRVVISRPFYLGRYEVTQAQWEAVMGNDPSQFKGRDHPVENVSWNDAQEFIRRLNAREGHARYRLPTEAEWEYAARAGSGAYYAAGDDEGALSRHEWYDGNSGETTHPVGQKLPNAWGLHDMGGNVVERVQDWYDKEYYANSPETDPKGPADGSYRVLRGGSWAHDVVICRPAMRAYDSLDDRYDYVGFRLAFSAE